jgi:phenylacetate-coenzyme A ligase PaaK-like adenylate-forming protein
MHLVNSIGKFYFNTRLPAIDRFIADPVVTQFRVFSELLHRAKDTEFGRKYEFEDSDYTDFRVNVPLQDYESLKPYFARMQASEANVLWPDTIRWFAKSSGTTNDASKFIPVSEEGLHASHIKTGKDFLSLYLRNKPTSKFFTGKGLVMGGAYHANEANSKVFVGDVSAILMKNLDTWIQYFREPSLSVALLPSWEEKLDRISDVTMRQNVTSISGVPSWTLLLLRKVLEKTKQKQIKDVWPNLELFCHGGVGFAPYRPQFEELIGQDISYQNVYNASEGFFAFQDTLDNDNMLLHLDSGVFYEFIPFNGALDTQNIVTIEGVKKGVNYAMVISTNSGLWRYMIGDTVEFTDVAPYRIRITGRTKHYINVFGEEVTIDNTDKALASACADIGAKVVDYTIAPVFLNQTNQGRHQWGIEFCEEPADVNTFEAVLDRKLQSLNSDYQAKRTGDLAMGNLAVVPLHKGTFYEWLKSKEKLGSQQKIPRLQNDRQFISELMQISEKLN